MERLPEHPLTVDDFLENEAFRTWVLERRPEDRVCWQVWLLKYPEKNELYEQAVATFLVLQGKPIEISDQQVKENTEKILNQLSENPIVIKPFVRWQWGRWATAAAVVGLTLWWQLGASISTPFKAVTKQTVQPVQDMGWKIVKNSTGQPQVVLLPDNSSVLLSTGSQIRFYKQNIHKLREVYLKGEGFFEVAKNPTKPFVVYTANLTTKALGTSFQVHSFDQEEMTYVKVKTGKVTVTPIGSPNKEVLLTVNEQLKLGTTTKELVKLGNVLAEEKPAAIITQQFTFNYTPIPDVFDQLEASYHMPIQYDRRLLTHCTFTGELNDVPFLEKIRLICLAIESTYKISDNKAIIHSKGCD